MITEKQIATSIESHPAGVRLVRLVCSAALACLVFAGCSKSDSEAEHVPGDGAIRITSQIAASRQSRGVTLGDKVLANVILLRTDITTATTPSSFFGSSRITASRQTDGKLTDFSSVPYYYKTNNDYAHFVAFHPDANSYSPSEENWTLNGGKDLLLTETPWCAGRYSAPVTTGMTFEHQLAQLQVICKPDPDAALALVTAAWGQITKIHLLETAAKATFDCATRAMSFSVPVTMALRKTDCETVFAPVTLAANTTTPCAGGIYAPDASGTAVLKLKVYSATTPEGKEVEVQLKQSATDKGFAKGMTHTVTLTFGVVNKNIAVSATSVEAWGVNNGTGGQDGITSDGGVAVEDYYYTDGTTSRTLNSAKTVEGVIFWVDPTSLRHFKIVSMDGPPRLWDGSENGAGKLPWSKEQVFSGANSPSDGKANTLKIMKVSTAIDYKAAKWCYQKNGAMRVPAVESATTSDADYKWYLPARDEVQHLFCALKGVTPRTWAVGTLTGVPTAASGYPPAWNARFTATPFAGGSYWSSTEFDTAVAWNTGFGSGSTTSGSKIENNYVRCVREIDLRAAPPAVGDYYYTDGTTSMDKDLTRTVEGVVFWVDTTNPYHFKIASLDEPPANWDGGTNPAGGLLWSTENAPTVGTSSNSDGKANTLSLMMRPNAATTYPAAKWCYTRNKSLSVPAASSATTSDPSYRWYLPAKDELQYLFCAYRGAAPTTWVSYADGAPTAALGYPAAWNERFTTPFTAILHWMSTQYDTNTAWYLTFSTGHTFNSNKGLAIGNVRCIREITL